MFFFILFIDVAPHWECTVVSIVTVLVHYNIVPRKVLHMSDACLFELGSSLEVGK
jgi:hypothetical protein